jgi:RHS repeat-associated protein
MGTNAYAYVYDPIGNRLTASANADTNLYAANALNQYSTITYQSNSLQPNSLSPAYDLDGNMLTNGPWAYTWDAENRMASACSNGVLLVTNVYDHLSRRIRKEVYARANTTSNYEPVTCNTFLYDGWNVIRETALLNSLTPPIALTNYYTWGLDLSGTMQGAGGVGGLLAVTTLSTCNNQPVTCNTYYPAYDANGNVTAYLDATGGVAIAFSYDPFGRTVSETVNALPGAVYLPHRFSTKYLDPETGMYYYGYRFYHPELGRWVSRDPIGEKGGINNYAVVVNSTINLVDVLGLEEVNSWSTASCAMPTKTIAKSFPVAFKGFTFKSADRYIVLSEITATLIVAGPNSNGELDANELATRQWGTHWLTYRDGTAPVRHNTPCRKKYICSATCSTPCCASETKKVFDKYVNGTISSTHLSAFPPGTYDSAAPGQEMWVKGSCILDSIEKTRLRAECEKRARVLCSGTHTHDLIVPAW